MFLGHYAVGLGAKRFVPQVPLGWLVAAATLLDLIWPAFLLLGWEHVRVVGSASPFLTFEFLSYPISHSLVTAFGWGAALALVYLAARRDVRGAWTVGLLVPSHWVLDFVVHRPDLPLWPGGQRVGLGIWGSPAATVAIELTLLTLGAGLYVSATRARDRVGRWAWVVFVLVLVVMFGASAAAPTDPAMPVAAIAAVGLGAWLFVLWAGWFDRHREAAPART